jgi:subtilisin family serine protease
MARFVLAKRRRKPDATKSKAKEPPRWREVLKLLGPSAVPVNEPETPDGDDVRILVIEVDENQLNRSRLALPSSILLEPEIEHHPLLADQTGGAATPVTLRLASGKAVIPGALVSAFLHDDSSLPAFSTDKDGKVELPIQWSKVKSLVIIPLTGYWAVELSSPPVNRGVECPPVSFAPGGLGWWHSELGINSPDPQLGEGIRIGLLDTGVGNHPALKHVERIGSWDNGRYLPSRNPRGYITLHGTHVCGILGARLSPRGKGFWGIAPGSVIVAGNILREAGFASQADLANGVLALALDNATDLINISQGSPFRSEILLEAIEDAEDAGCLCICAAGNSKGALEWPARSARTIAVTAIGRNGSMPEGVRSARYSSSAASIRAENGLFFASFSCRGAEVNCCAPGVAIISALPKIKGLVGLPWGPMDGTSMSAPAVTGVLAALLSRSVKYLKSPRDKGRVRIARQILKQACRGIGLDRSYEGDGIPRFHA